VPIFIDRGAPTPPSPHFTRQRRSSPQRPINPFRIGASRVIGGRWASKERVAQLDQAEKARRQAEQQQDAKDQSAIERNNRFGGTQAALNLSSEEIQLVKVYIRPAPSTGAPADAIKVGDIVDGATIPLPSPLTEKIPKLLGARFAIRNGAIIIVRKDSRQADAVLAPN